MKTFKSIEELEGHNKQSFEKIFGSIAVESPVNKNHWDKITYNSRPSDVFKLDWSSYSALQWADTFLPYTGGYKGKAMWTYDGAEIFAGLQKSEQKLFKFDKHKYLISLISYTYPKGVEAERQKKRISLTEHEVVTFFELSKNDKIDIHFSFGSRFKRYLEEYFTDTENPVNLFSLEKQVYQTELSTVQKFFNRKLVHHSMMSFILETIGVNVKEVENPEKRVIENWKWLNENNEIIRNKKDKQGEETLLSNILFGEKIKFLINGKRLKNNQPINITIGLLNEKKEFIKEKFISFDTKAKDNKTQTPLFRIPFEWYDASQETYDYSTHITKVNEIDLSKITAKITIGKRAFFIEESEQLTPDSYRRNYEELIGLYKKNGKKNEKDKTDNYENHFISLNKQIETIVGNFEKFICQANSLIAEQIAQQVKQDATQLWLAAVQQVQGGTLDDRPLYWARNKMQAVLKRHPLFKEQIDFEKSIILPDTELHNIIQLFEQHSRNFTGINFANAPEGAKKVLLTGFDPFQLDPIYYDGQRYTGIKTFNPSGILALQVNNLVIGENLFIQTCIFPVRYEDFDNGIVEGVISKYFEDADIILTTSRNDFNWDIEKYATSYRGGFHDNMNIGDSDSKYDNKRFFSNKNSDFTETSLPREKLFESNSNNAVIGGQIIRFDDAKSSKNGSGGNYLSNEIMYRTTKLRDSKNSVKPVGHFHIYMTDKTDKNELVKKVIVEILKKIVQ